MLPQIEALEYALWAIDRWPNRSDMWHRGSDDHAKALEGMALIIFALQAEIREREAAGAISMSLGPPEYADT